jgi:hypothetical protein
VDGTCFFGQGERKYIELNTTGTQAHFLERHLHIYFSNHTVSWHRRRSGSRRRRTRNGRHLRGATSRGRRRL